MDTDNAKNNLSAIKRRITSSIKDLDPHDYIDICVLIKSNTTKTDMINETPRGTFIDLDQIQIELLQQLDHMIFTKLQRISER